MNVNPRNAKVSGFLSPRSVRLAAAKRPNSIRRVLSGWSVSMNSSTHITHVDDGFTFLGHRIIRRRGARGRMSVVTTIPKEKAKAFACRLAKSLSGNHDIRKVDMFDSLNRQLAGWAAFYKFTDFTAHMFRRIDNVVFWKLAHWLGRKHRSRIRPLMRRWFKAPEAGRAKTWQAERASSGEALASPLS